MKQNQLKEKMKSGQTVYGTFIHSCSTIACEVAGLSGLDFVMIDSEHAPTDAIDNRELILASEYRDIVPLVRVQNGEYNTILRMLDVGAHGIMVPQVNTEEQAKTVCSAARYCPQGDRGVATTRAADYGFVQPMSEYFRMANERNLVIVQCENIKALDELEEIVSTEGVDIVFVGPYDLSSSMRNIGHVGYEYIHETVDQVLMLTKKYHKFAGIFTKDAKEAKFYSEMGFRFIVVGSDISLMVGSFKTLSNALKE